MPNGGSDCCGTCWFNAKNKGEGGYARTKDPEPAFCIIRNLPISGDPFYTYCGNHPHRRPDRDPIPIGPVFTGDSLDQRRVWTMSPDTEDIREHLLVLVSEIEEEPRTEYPSGVHLDELVVWQLGDFSEMRAVEQLERVASFDPAATEAGPFGRTRQGLVKLACEALKKIEDGPA